MVFHSHRLFLFLRILDFNQAPFPAREGSIRIQSRRQFCRSERWGSQRATRTRRSVQGPQLNSQAGGIRLVITFRLNDTRGYRRSPKIVHTPSTAYSSTRAHLRRTQSAVKYRYITEVCLCVFFSDIKIMFLSKICARLLYILRTQAPKYNVQFTHVFHHVI